MYHIYTYIPMQRLKASFAKLKLPQSQRRHTQGPTNSAMIAVKVQMLLYDQLSEMARVEMACCLREHLLGWFWEPGL